MTLRKRRGSRRTWAPIAAASLGLCALLTACGGSGSDAISVSIGRQPFAAGNSPVTQYMIDNDLLEEAAEELGHEVNVEYRDYPSAAPQVEAMIGGRLDIGMWGNTPVIRAVAQDQPVSVISVGEGRMRFVLATREGSGINDIEDLRGKTVGLLVGGDPHMAFAGMLEQELGSADPADADIKLVNLPTQAIAATVPDGVDATVVIYPALLKQQDRDDSIRGVINSLGTTESGYDGAAGTGEGNGLESVDSSAFAPEGFYGHRSFWVARDEFMQEHPEVVTAFLIAEQWAIEALTGMSQEDVSDSVNDYWDLDADKGRLIVEDEILFRRGWAWATNSDAVLLKNLSDLMASNGVLPESLPWEDIVAEFEGSAEVVEAAYDGVGSTPAADAFEPTDDDARGSPHWETNTWTGPEGADQ